MARQRPGSLSLDLRTQGPRLVAAIDRSAPTMSRQSRQLLLSYATVQRWPVLKGDIKGAFLQGVKGEEKREIHAWPVEELADALAVPRDQPVQLLKACYGLVNVEVVLHDFFSVGRVES